MRRFLMVVVMAWAGPVWADTPTISVTGTGEVSVAPDMARVSLGVVAQGDTAAQALDQMSADLQNVLEGFAAHGIAPADIQTSGLNLSPGYKGGGLSSGKRAIAGYDASSQVTVIIRDLAILGDTLDAVVDVGANQMNGLWFDVADRSAHLTAARILAVQDAQGKAATFADAAGLDLGDVVTLREGGQGGGQPMMMEMAMSRSSVPVAEGEITISATVSIDYAVTP